MQRLVVDKHGMFEKQKKVSLAGHNDREEERKTQKIKRPCCGKCDEKPLEGLKWETNKILTEPGSWEGLRVVATTGSLCYDVGCWLESVKSELGRHNTRTRDM